MRMTLDEIRRKGLEALTRALGKAGMMRFMQQFETGSGNYARERRAWVDEVTIDDIKTAAAKKRRKKK